MMLVGAVIGLQVLITVITSLYTAVGSLMVQLGIGMRNTSRVMKSLSTEIANN